MATSRRWFVVGLIALAAGVAPAVHAQETVFQLATNDTRILNHWPTTDAMIGTSDDVVSGSSSGLNSSGPNDLASYSFNAFDFGSGSTDPWMPPTMNAMTFLDGTVTIDMGVAAGGVGPLVTAWNLSGTEPFLTHGPYSSTLAAVNSGSYNNGTGSFALDVDFAADIGGLVDTSLAFSMTGVAWVVDLVGSRGGTGNVYVDSVLTPIGLALNASALVFLTGSGTVPTAVNFSWGTMPVVATLFGLAPTGVAVESETWGAIKGLYR